MEELFYVYILASRPYGYLYIGMTNNLPRRLYEHQHGLVEGHSQRFHIKTLVYYEAAVSPEVAIAREKQLKRYPRQWKFNLIERQNPHWQALAA